MGAAERDVATELVDFQVLRRAVNDAFQGQVAGESGGFELNGGPFQGHVTGPTLLAQRSEAVLDQLGDALGVEAVDSDAGLPQLRTHQALSRETCWPKAAVNLR